MVKVIGKSEEIPQVESIITTIEIAKKLEEEDKLYICPNPSGASFRLEEEEPLSVNDKEQDTKTFADNLRHILHVASHILAGTEENIKNKYSIEFMDAIRDKFIDETFRSRFFIGTTSKSYLFTDVDYTVSNKVATSEIVLNPTVPYLTLWFYLIESLTNERKKIPIDMDIQTFRLVVRQMNEINEKLKDFVK